MKWEGEENLDNYQDLLCFICGATKPGSMTICKNELDARYRNDDFARVFRVIPLPFPSILQPKTRH